MQLIEITMHLTVDFYEIDYNFFLQRLHNVPPSLMCILCKLLVPKILLCKKICRIYFAIFSYAMFCKKFPCKSFVKCLEMLHLFTFTLFFVLHLLLSIVMVLCSFAGYSCEFNFKFFLI